MANGGNIGFAPQGPNIDPGFATGAPVLNPNAPTPGAVQQASIPTPAGPTPIQTAQAKRNDILSTQFGDSPFAQAVGGVGLVLQEFAAGFEGRAGPIAGIQKRVQQQQALGIQRSLLGLKATSQLLDLAKKVPAEDRAELIEKFTASIDPDGNLFGEEITDIVNAALTAPDIAEAIKAATVFGEEYAAFFGPDTEGMKAAIVDGKMTEQFRNRVRIAEGPVIAAKLAEWRGIIAANAAKLGIEKDGRGNFLIDQGDLEALHAISGEEAMAQLGLTEAQATDFEALKLTPKQMDVALHDKQMFEDAGIGLEGVEAEDRATAKDINGVLRFVDTGEPVFDVEKEARESKKDANDRLRFTDTGELVFPDVEVAEDEPDSEQFFDVFDSNGNLVGQFRGDDPDFDTLRKTPGHTVRRTATIRATGPEALREIPKVEALGGAGAGVEGADVGAPTTATGFSGRLADALNVIASAVGAGLPAERAEVAKQAIITLNSETKLILAGEIKGRPSNLLLEEYEKFSPKPGSFVRSDEAALIRLIQTRNFLARRNAIFAEEANDGTRSPGDRATRRGQVTRLNELLKQYNRIIATMETSLGKDPSRLPEGIPPGSELISRTKKGNFPVYRTPDGQYLVVR